MVITKEHFIKIYSNLPLGVRNEIIIVVDNEPITWNVAYMEIKENTGKGKQILKKLENLNIIKSD